MTRLFSVLFIAVLFFGCGKSENAGDQTAQNDEDVLTVSQLLDAPDDFVDKEVKLAGTITHICIHAGKRMHLTDIDSDVKIKVEAGEAIGSFDRDLEGSDVIVTGLLREERIDEAFLVAWEEELQAELKEEEHDDHEGHVEPQGLEAIKSIRAELKVSGKDYLSRWSLDGQSFEITAVGESVEDDDATHDHSEHGDLDHGDHDDNGNNDDDDDEAENE